MTDEEYAEAQRLESEIRSLEYQLQRAIVENQNLQAELETLIQNIRILTENARGMDSDVSQSMDFVKGIVAEASEGTSELFALIDDLTNSYFTFKNLSTASKNVTQFTDEYFTKFKFFNELRRISLGYVIGLDAHIISNETMRKKVETVYLQNTEYWLAYAIMSVMLWANDDEDAALRAMKQSLSMDYQRSALFYLLIYLRFDRKDPAKKWFLSYLDRVDIDNLGNEWQYLLQAYLCGVFGADEEFRILVKGYLDGMLQQMESMHPDYGNRVAERTKKYADAFIHVTKNEFETLRRNCTEYEELKSLLSTAEKNEVLAIRMRETMEADNNLQENMKQRIEDILYDLINAYDLGELKVVKNKRYNEMIIQAKGDLGLAQQFYNNEFPDDESHTLHDLLFDWAFEEDASQVDITVKKFALAYLKKWLSKGFQMFGEEYRKREKERYNISIDGWEKQCGEDSYPQASDELMNHYNKNRVFNMLKDKYMQIFIGMALASLVVLIITVFAFNPVTLVIGILLGVIGGFLIWRRVVDLEAILEAKKRKGLETLQKALEELKSWRTLYKQEDAKNTDLVSVFDNVEV